MYASVIVEIGAKNVDRTFTYRVPSDMKSFIKIGSRVKVSFGKQLLEGFVLDLFNDIDSCDYEIKDIIELVDKKPILNEEMLELGKEISNYTLCSLISAYQVMLPKALKASYDTNISIKTNKYLILNCSINDANNYLVKCRYDGQIDILNNIINNKEIKINRVDSSVKTLIKHGIVKIIEKESYRYRYTSNNNDCRHILNDEQEYAVKRVCDCFNKSSTFLLYGVTGSGKTEVYMNIIDKVVNIGKSAIMLVPEISLTPQIVDRFVSRFGDKVAILHSGLSDGERYDEYRKIVNGEVSIVVGARSAIFAPLKDIGVIIIDEEHSSTYKQDNNPRYHARDVALFRCKYHSCPLVLGSATPSLESMARAGNKVYELITLKRRASGGSLPNVCIVDMKNEIKQGNYIFSSVLDKKIKEKLSKKEQIILFLNRRGYSSIYTCNTCGNVSKCPNCDISLTYHKSSGMLRCHYCGYAIRKYSECPNCHSKDLIDYGLGTEQLEEELVKRYKARVVRMDMDTTSKKGTHQKIIDEFGNYKYDILIGTQMVSKGLDFPMVTLVGVINADASLNIPDFRSSERTFQLLCQVSGRAGRSIRDGEVVIQSYNNNHYSIMLAKNHDYLSFYMEEMKIRKQLNYSPYYYIILVNIMSKDYEYSFSEAKKIGEFLRTNLSDDTFVLGPAMANPFKVNNVYHHQCIIKYKKDNKLRDTLIMLDNHYKFNNKINVEIDIDPNKC
ncbi:MAG: primosomal protein N' [Bacilli bacterium]|nr:primosomal protein N' [Bacilli bacterium]